MTRRLSPTAADLLDSLRTLPTATYHELSDHTGRPPGSIATMLKRLEQRGQARRAGSVRSTEKPAVRVTLWAITDDGRKALEVS